MKEQSDREVENENMQLLLEEVKSHSTKKNQEADAFSMSNQENLEKQKQAKVSRKVPQNVDAMKQSAGETTTIEQNFKMNQVIQGPQDKGKKTDNTITTIAQKVKKQIGIPEQKGGLISAKHKNTEKRFAERVARVGKDNNIHYGDLITIRCESQHVHLVSYNRLYDSINCEDYGIYECRLYI